MKTKSSYKQKIREFMESRTYDLQEEIDKMEAEVKSILNSDYKNWPRISEIADQVNVIVGEWGLLDELICFKKSKVLVEDECPL